MKNLAASKSFTFISLFTSVVALSASYVFFIVYLRSTSQELVTNWSEAEAISLQEGNYLTAVAKNQRVLMSSDFIRGVTLIDLDRHEKLAEFGETIEFSFNQRLPLRSLELVGPFKFLVSKSLSSDGGIVALFLVGPSYAPWTFLIYALSIVVVSVASLVLLQFQERKEANRREGVVRRAIIDLVSDLPPSKLLQNETPQLVQKWSQMKELLESAKHRERELAHEAALSVAAMQIAHDINSPLSALNMIASSKNIAKLPEGKLLEQVASRILNISRTILLTNRVNTLSKVECDLNVLLNQLVTEKALEFSLRSNVKIILSTDSKAMPTLIDPVEFGRVISNIINNSINAIGESVGAIIISSFKDGNFVSISISDNGPGIPSDLLSNLGKRGVTGSRGGHGLGLFHAKTQVAMWGGHLTIQSKTGQGTTVTIHLPLDVPQAATNESVPQGSMES